MTHRPTTSAAIRWMLACACSASAWPLLGHAATPLPCDSPVLLDTPVLYGRWQATFPLRPDLPSVTLALAPHTEWQGTVQGSATYGTQVARMVGDVDAGAVTLEESFDGTRIRATWLGTVEPDSCGARITGERLDDDDADGTAFILRKTHP